MEPPRPGRLCLSWAGSWGSARAQAAPRWKISNSPNPRKTQLPAAELVQLGQGELGGHPLPPRVGLMSPPSVGWFHAVLRAGMAAAAPRPIFHPFFVVFNLGSGSLSQISQFGIGDSLWEPTKLGNHRGSFQSPSPASQCWDWRSWAALGELGCTWISTLGLHPSSLSIPGVSSSSEHPPGCGS